MGEADISDDAERTNQRLLQPFALHIRTLGYPSTQAPATMAQPATTPQHTDPATKRDEKKNEETVKDKPDGKKKTTQQK